MPPTKPRKSSKNPPIFSHEYFIKNHADIVSMVAMVIVMGLMFQVTSPICAPFITVAYDVTPNVTGNSNVQRALYNIGWKDVSTVFFYTLVCIALHAVLQECVLDKITKKLHLSKVKHNRFNEYAQLLAFFVVSSIWALDIVIREYFLSITKLWEQLPHTEMHFSLKFYFIIQLAYWVHCYPELYLQKVKRDEIFARVIYATTYLTIITSAYAMHFNRVGCCLLFLHYLSESFTHFARLFEFVDKEEKRTRIVSGLSDGVFVFSRLTSFILSCLTFWYGSSDSKEHGVDVSLLNFTVLFVVSSYQIYLMYHFLHDRMKLLRTIQVPFSKPVTKQAKKFTKDKNTSDNELTEADQNIRKDQKLKKSAKSKQTKVK